jgi:hypothetical protein
MKKTVASCLLLALVSAGVLAADKDTHLYEMRTYYAAPGKLEELNARFRNHTLKLFEKHGMQNIGYWEPIDNPDGKLIYILAYPNREAREKSWKDFMGDPDWQAAHKESEKNGKLVAKSEQVFMNATDYSPAIKASKSDPIRAFELRVYTAAPGRLDALNARFRDHTMQLFKKHGMENIGYWVPAQGQKGADDTLIYILAHKTRDAAAASFRAFGADTDWMKARKASEDKAGGSLTAPNGVKSTFMKPTDYSPMK